jgi:hypothetical protein
VAYQGGLPLALSHSLTLLSSAQLTSQRPSGDQAPVQHLALVACSLPLALSHSLTLLSPAQLASQRPSGDQAQCLTQVW